MSNATMAVIASPVGALELRVVDGYLTRIHFAGSAAPRDPGRRSSPDHTSPTMRQRLATRYSSQT